MPASFVGKLADPAWRRERALRANKARHSVDTYIESIVNRAPELTDAQIDRLSAVFNRGRSSPDDRGAA